MINNKVRTSRKLCKPIAKKELSLFPIFTHKKLMLYFNKNIPKIVAFYFKSTLSFVPSRNTFRSLFFYAYKPTQNALYI